MFFSSKTIAYWQKLFQKLITTQNVLIESLDPYSVELPILKDQHRKKNEKSILYRITATPSAGEVIYTPPSAAEMPSMMSEMVKWLNSELDNN